MASFEVAGSSPIHLKASIAMLMAQIRSVSHVRAKGSEIIFSGGIGHHEIATDGWVQLPFPLDALGVIQMAENFFRQMDPKDQPTYPDHDGSNSPGWKVARKGYWGAISVSFKWMEHHK